MHQVGCPRDPGGRERQRVDQVGLRARRRWDGRPRAVLVEVVREANGDAAIDCAEQRALDGVRERVRQPQVVDRDVERLLSLRDPVGQQACDLPRRLAAVGERVEVYRAAFARSPALYARFAAW
jgi:hypothetical protein